MKIALFGRGKTGSKVLECASSGVQILGPYSRSRLPSTEELRKADVAIVFVPGVALPSLLPLLLEAGIPVVSGATGHSFSEEEKGWMTARKVAWVQAANFSLGMSLALVLARKIGSFPPARAQGEAAITETHHAKKLDSPSGTALALQEALSLPASITSRREGDIVGDHSLTLRLPGETLALSHQATDRRVFANGALWAAELALRERLAPGFHRFEDLVTNHCFGKETL